MRVELDYLQFDSVACSESIAGGVMSILNVVKDAVNHFLEAQ